MAAPIPSRVAVVTGAASGIGRALAVAYAAHGVRTVVGAYPADPHDPAETVRLVEAAGGTCVVQAVDVRDAAQVEMFAQRAIDEWGRLDVAVANAGVLRKRALADLTDAEWEDTLQVDLAGVLRTFRSAAARMDGGGAMVAVSSIAGAVYGWAGHAHYAAAKAGVVGLCRSLAVELAPRRIRVNAVIPGLIDTPQSSDPVNSLGPRGLARAADRIPWGRVGRPEEVASVIRFLTSEDAGYVTGQAFVVDGGLSVTLPH
ncbi:SDR family NAD(P)-dependent oxidoreductase [Nonomuraea jiangxiensis]|uniref:3-oxoacyl-[acyl-carrier protein] reductase n=1 Tax=Nonomuraea jiangxiensis TaxID=633440 RepID=A0A1G8JN88_9ACTN|nr:SDR family NAD(P)-dependent oxidoreductase [Nonomuraea jiangxiensis]SDI32714.1 3-oxoacyl-[acyl-carrier protein] reductase [Nonomuraea jiangxiensis]